MEVRDRAGSINSFNQLNMTLQDLKDKDAEIKSLKEQKERLLQDMIDIQKDIKTQIDQQKVVI